MPDQTSTRCFSPPLNFNPLSPNLCFPILRQSRHKLFNLCLLSDSVDLLWCGSHVAIVDVVIESVIEQIEYFHKYFRSVEPFLNEEQLKQKYDEWSSECSGGCCSPRS
jgi:hypothetical protein